MQPSILNYRILFTKDHGPKYVVDHTGRHYCIYGDKWLNAPAEDSEACQSRAVLPSDLSMLVVHGLLGDGDYSMLNSNGFISPTVAKIWELKKKLQDHLDHLESMQPFNFDDFDVSSLPDDIDDDEQILNPEPQITEVENA